MVTKKNLWYLTFFSIILILAVYYISTPESDANFVNAEVSQNEDLSVTVTESEAITALRINRDEELEKEVSLIKEILTSDTKTSEEKSDAYEALKSLNNNKGKEETLEKLIKKNYNFENFVKIDGNNVKVVLDTSNHSYELANKIIRSIQDEFEKKMYITVNFQTK